VNILHFSKRRLLPLLAAGACWLLPAPVRAETPVPPVKTDFLWSGSWETGGNIDERLDLRLSAFGFTLRAQALDRRPGPLRENWLDGQALWPRFSGGLYHAASGSRLLYGVLDEWGLPARLNNISAKSLAFPAARKETGADLKTSFTAGGEDALLLLLTWLFPAAEHLFFRPWAEFSLSSAGGNGLDSPAFSTGLESRFFGMTLKTGFFGTGRHLAAKEISSWFSDPPPLPERDFELYGMSIHFSHPWFSVAADGALSRTFARGEDYYGNIAASFGTRPWLVSFAAENTGPLFSDRRGQISGGEFRTGARFELKQARSGLFRLDAVLRGAAAGTPLNRSNFSVYYRFPARAARAAPALFWPGRISLSAGRDGRNIQKVLDSADIAFSWLLGPVRMDISGSLDGHARGKNGEELPAAHPFPAGPAWDFSAARAAGEITWSPGIFRFGLKAGRSWSAKKDPFWDGSLSASINGRIGRISVKASCDRLPDKWSGAISWRLNF
jgi:hypothetical protein